jgi:hypothetical protein
VEGEADEMGGKRLFSMEGVKPYGLIGSAGSVRDSGSTGVRQGGAGGEWAGPGVGASITFCTKCHLVKLARRLQKRDCMLACDPLFSLSQLGSDACLC